LKKFLSDNFVIKGFSFTFAANFKKLAVRDLSLQYIAPFLADRNKKAIATVVMAFLFFKKYNYSIF
jgi:hypothetical protein